MPDPCCPYCRERHPAAVECEPPEVRAFEQGVLAGYTCAAGDRHELLDDTRSRHASLEYRSARRAGGRCSRGR